MRVPTAILPHTVTVEAYEGTSGSGAPAYGPAFDLRARVEGARRAVRTSAGTDAITSAVAFIRPEAPDVPPESRVTHAGRTYEVLDVVMGEGMRRPSHRELLLGGPRG